MHCILAHRFYDAMGSKTYEPKQSSTEGDSRPARGKDERAIEKVVLLSEFSVIRIYNRI